MGFLGKLLKIITMLPSLIIGVESIFGSKSGKEKQNLIVSFVGSILGIAESIAAKDIVDEDAFQEGLKKAIDGVVQMLNASVWHK